MTTPATTPTVTMLWMESTRPGSAAGTHLAGSRERIDLAGITVDEQISSTDNAEGLVGKLRRLGSLIMRARKAARGGVLVTRWHPLLAFVSPRWERKGGRILLLVQGNDESTYEANPWLRKIPGSRRMMTRSLARASYILTVNKGLKIWVEQERAAAGAPQVPVDVMPTGVSDLFFEATPVVTDEPYALFFGGLAPWQGVDYMLEAHASPTWPTGVNLVVIGDGARAEAVNAAQSETLTWLGPLAPAELAGHVAGAMVTLCPKANTGSMARTTTPFKIIESVAAGVPVIATDIPAQVDMLEDGYGLLVDVNDPEDLARAVAKLHADSALRDSLAARAREVSPNFRWATSAPQLSAAVDAVWAQSAAGRKGNR